MAAHQWMLVAETITPEVAVALLLLAALEPERRVAQITRVVLVRHHLFLADRLLMLAAAVVVHTSGRAAFDIVKRLLVAREAEVTVETAYLRHQAPQARLVLLTQAVAVVVVFMTLARVTLAAQAAPASS